MVSDLDLRNRTEFIYELFGEIDFQGHSIELNWRTSSGKDGIFEWILDGEKGVTTHRRFIENGKITGKPNSR